jgi:hypothetical protein
MKVGLVVEQTSVAGSDSFDYGSLPKIQCRGNKSPSLEYLLAYKGEVILG